ncbi:egg cell-secreted protein 1.3-like [Primulina huaijiensis]|uniref:egg cell-secreted protein 1.3-like n=1 Tax=Primulina huaijiensis TaxID=1492673 RepID=UPI003CC776D0
MACLVYKDVSARNHLHPMASFSFSGGLEVAGNTMDCLNALYKIRSCSDDIFAYFANGSIDISRQCCQAITLITHQCWPALLSTLGITLDQAYILRGYCDASASASTTASFAPFSSPVGQPMPAVQGGDDY